MPLWRSDLLAAARSLFGSEAGIAASWEQGPTLVFGDGYTITKNGQEAASLATKAVQAH